LNQTGVLFFAKEPTQRLFHVSVVCALFKGTGKVYILDRKELTGNLLEIVEDALLFLQKHLQLRWEITSKSTRRQEILELPEVALREAVLNVVSERKVSFQDQEYSLTALTRHLLENDYNVQPGPHWYFDGRSLTDIYDATYALP
jgi:predicted HTH transcriptional regulator